MNIDTAVRRRRRQRARAAARRAIRPVPHGHAPAGRRRPRPGRVDPGEPPGAAGGGDHGPRQRGDRRARAEARRLRLRLQAARPRRAAQAGRRARSSSRDARPTATDRRRGPRCSAIPRPCEQLRETDRARRAQPGAGATSPASPAPARSWSRGSIHESGPRARRALRAGQLRRDPQRADGERAVRPQARQLHRRGRRQGAWSRAPRAARCSSTRSPTCRCTCR